LILKLSRSNKGYEANPLAIISTDHNSINLCDFSTIPEMKFLNDVESGPRRGGGKEESFCYSKKFF
jgi:hypothetical protein